MGLIDSDSLPLTSVIFTYSSAIIIERSILVIMIFRHVFLQRNFARGLKEKSKLLFCCKYNLGLSLF